MKRLLPFVLLLWVAFAILSCEKETLLIIDQTSLEFPDAGGTSTIALTANKPWTASSDQSWCSVSPASGEDVSGSKINIRCDANPDYDGRNCTITFTCEEKVTVVSVSQSNASGLFVTTPCYELSNEKHTLAVEVKANVEYEVNPEVEGIRYLGTMGVRTTTAGTTKASLRRVIMVDNYLI